MSEKNENKQKQAGVGPLKKFYSKNVNTVAIEKTYSADFMIKMQIKTISVSAVLNAFYIRL